MSTCKFHLFLLFSGVALLFMQGFSGFLIYAQSTSEVHVSETHTPSHVGMVGSGNLSGYLVVEGSQVLTVENEKFDVDGIIVKDHAKLIVSILPPPYMVVSLPRIIVKDHAKLIVRKSIISTLHVELSGNASLELIKTTILTSSKIYFRNNSRGTIIDSKFAPVDATYRFYKLPWWFTYVYGPPTLSMDLVSSYSYKTVCYKEGRIYVSKNASVKILNSGLREIHSEGSTIEVDSSKIQYIYANNCSDISVNRSEVVNIHLTNRSSIRLINSTWLYGVYVKNYSRIEVVGSRGISRSEGLRCSYHSQATLINSTCGRVTLSNNASALIDESTVNDITIYVSEEGNVTIGSLKPGSVNYWNSSSSAENLGLNLIIRSSKIDGFSLEVSNGVHLKIFDSNLTFFSAWSPVHIKDSRSEILYVRDDAKVWVEDCSIGILACFESARVYVKNSRVSTFIGKGSSEAHIENTWITQIQGYNRAKIYVGMGVSYGSLHIKGTAKLIRTPEASTIYWITDLLCSAFFFSAVLSLSYLWIVGLSVLLNRIYIARNPWIEEVEEIKPWVSKALLWLNPVYFAWLYKKDRRKWIKYISIIGSATSILVGIFMGIAWYHFKLATLILRGEKWTSENFIMLIPGFMCGLFVLTSVNILLNRYMAGPSGRHEHEISDLPKEVEEKSPADDLYQRLIDRYCSVHGRSRSALEHKIKELTNLGLSREEAITRLAEEEGLTGRLEAAEEPSPASDIYSQLTSLYIRRTKEDLEHKIKEYMKEGLSREEAIRRLAWEEGIA